MLPRNERKKLDRLIRRYHQGKATASEIAFLEKYYNAFDKQQGLTERLNDGEKAATGERMYQHIHRQIALAENQPVIPLYRRLLKVAAAAAILLIVGVGIYWLARPGKPQSEAQSVLPAMPDNDVAPGITKATLTLANGKIIVLDSASYGVLATQGHTTIQNDDGQLIYQPAGDGDGLVFNTLTTARAQQYRLVLPDGSQVWLNAASSLRFPAAFSGTERRVELTGEAYFEVKHDAAKPFTVAVGEMDVQVLGTRFNINSYGDEQAVRTTLTEGSIKISAAGKERVLSPGQQAVYSGHEKLDVVKGVNQQQVLAWKNGTFYFVDMPLQYILRQAARWYDVDIIYEKPVTENYTVSIQRDVPISKLLQYLELMSKVHFTIEGKKVIVRP